MGLFIELIDWTYKRRNPILSYRQNHLRTDVNDISVKQGDLL